VSWQVKEFWKSRSTAAQRSPQRANASSILFARSLKRFESLSLDSFKVSAAIRANFALNSRPDGEKQAVLPSPFLSAILPRAVLWILSS